MTANQWAALLAPSLGTAFWWLVMYPGRKLADALWKRLPEGRLRKFLLYHVPGTDKR